MILLLTKCQIKNKLQSIIHNYSTFPIIIYESTEGNNFFIGGDSDMKQIINFIDSFHNMSQISASNSNQISNINLPSNININEGKRRLTYNLLLLTNKINLY